MIDPRIARSADQENVVRHLAEMVRGRLAGADERGHLIVGREPTELVVLGVLDPRDNLPPLTPNPALPDEPGVPVDILPPSEMGVTIWVDPHTDASEVCFDVTSSFAVYVPVFPTWGQQQEWMTGRRPSDGDDDADAADDLVSDDEDTVVGDDEVAGDYSPLVSGRPAGSTPPQPPPSKGGRSVSLAPVYKRVVVQANFPICVPLDGRTVNDGGRIQAALNQMIEQERHDRLAVLLSGKAKRGISPQAIAGGEAVYEAELDTRRTGVLPPFPTVEFMAATTRDPRGGWRVNLTLANTATAATRRDKPGQTLYDAGFDASLLAATMKNFGYKLSDVNWRVDPQVYAHGRFCVGEVNDARTSVSTNTWPVYRDRVFESRPELQPAFSDLVTDPLDVLERIASQMDDFAADWEAFLQSGGLTTTRAWQACSDQLTTFRDESARFRRGVRLVASDANIRQAFMWANEAFLALNTPGGLNPDSSAPRGTSRITSWRLFQVVFIVLGLAALAARESDDAGLAAELEIADVLWFPTGGGKSEAFLGLVAVAMFFDRLRGKDFGVTAMVRFPLRMLSVQQLERILRVVVACEAVRQREAGKGRQLGEPFELGYFVGRFNTPNTITNPRDDRWGDIAAMANWSAETKARRVVVTACPYCDAPGVVLEPDLAAVRLHHRCPSCMRRIPVVVTDDEVFRTLPAVVVATVDKLAAVAFQPHFSHFTHGPAYRCPDHGFVTFARGRKGQRHCLAQDRCKRAPTTWAVVKPKDPSPALVIQDELHLLAEELGTLAAHYETLFAHLCREGSGRAPKIIAATATISDYENQIHQLYALAPRRFPTEGFRDGETFYATRLELTRRLFIGALPSHLDTAQFGLAVAATWREGLESLRGADPAEIVDRLGLVHYTTRAEIDELLFRYELELFYANRKNDAERMYEQERRRGERGPARFDAVLLTGDTPLSEISAAIRRVEADSLASAPDPADRLAAVVGTSLVSHGVDLARLNVMHVAGMPSTNAYYVQATARAGRSDVGVVFVAFSRSFSRDRSAFHFFEPQHQYANDLVEAVSLNRFAVNAPDKTATGVLSALIINRIARDTTLNPPIGNEITNFSLTEPFKIWLAGQPSSFDQNLIDEVKTAFGVRAAVLDRNVAGYFADSVERRVRDELGNLRAGTRVTIQKCFLNKPPSSFRDIDEAVEFGAHGYWSKSDFKTLTNLDASTARGGEFEPASEEEEAG